MASARIEEIGNTYDLLIATRDGSTLACKNKDGQVINLAQLAYMTSVSAQNQQHEETELQHKDQLIQLASSNLIDREFDQWPQVTQGDWSGGALQRILTGSTPLSSFAPQSDPTRYWDGQGIIWPITDYLPQQPVLGSPDQGESGAIMKFSGNGITGGVPGSFGATSARLVAYMQNLAPQHNILWLRKIGSDSKLDPIPGSTNGTPAIPGAAGTIDYCIGLGYVWLVHCAAGGVAPVSVEQYSSTLGLLNSTTIANAQTSASGSWPGSRIATGVAGNKPYVAVSYFDAGGSGDVRIRLYDMSPNVLFSSFIDITVGNIGQQFSTPVQIDFQNDTLIIALVAGQLATLVAYNIPSTTFSTLANFTAVNNLYFCPIAGGIFVLASNDVAAFGFANTVDMYLIQGGQLQHIGPVTVQATTQGLSNVITGTCEPVAIGPYVVFPIYYFPVGGSTTRVAVFSYDVLRGRITKLQDFGAFNQFLGNQHGRRSAITAPVSRSTLVGSLVGQWAVDVPVLSTSGAAQDVSNAQGMLVSVSNGSFQPFLQQGVQITSSLIDFTSAQPKLYRQVVMTWLQPGLPSDSAITVQVDVWLDQDPANLNASPDFTTGVVGSGVNGGVTGQTTLKLLINKIARKLVYRVTTIGPSATPTSAVKLVSVIVQASTGWTRTMMLDLADNVVTNGKNDMCWDRQSTPGSPAIDGTAAYNFLRQLWRLRGGEVTATFPNGDATADWLLQDLHFDSPKPFGASMRADQKSSLGFLATVKMREDI